MARKAWGQSQQGTGQLLAHYPTPCKNDFIYLANMRMQTVHWISDLLWTRETRQKGAFFGDKENCLVSVH